MESPKVKILVIRLSSIGDIILTTPVIRALYKQLNADITLMTKKKFSWVLRNNPYINRIIHYEEGLPKETQFDIIVDLQKNLRSKIISLKAGATYFSFNKLNIKKWILTTFKYNALPGKHLVDRYFEGVSKLKVINDGKGLDYFLQEKEIDKFNLPATYLAINCGGTYFTKRIPASLVNRMIASSNIPVVLLGGSDVDDDVKGLSGNHIYNLIGKTDFNESVNVLNQAVKLITSDSALMHVGAALAKDMEVYWGNTLPDFGMYPYASLDHKTKVINRQVPDLNCRPCSKLGKHSCPKGHFKCMLDQEV